MSMIYSDYSRDRIGWFFGVSGSQLALLAASALPVIISLQDGAWMAALGFSAMWLLVLVITVVPVHGRSATGWFLASTAFAIGGLARWTRWRSKASTGQIENLTEADLPGVLNGVDVHDGPPQGPELLRVAIIQNHAAKAWAVTAAVTHPGIGMRVRRPSPHGAGPEGPLPGHRPACSLGNNPAATETPAPYTYTGLTRTSVCRRRRPTPHSHQPVQRLEERNRTREYPTTGQAAAASGPETRR